MPCQSPIGYCDDMTMCTNNAYKANADAATRAACDLRTILRRGGTEGDLTVETRLWVAQHDREDAVRIAEETANGERDRVRSAAKIKYDKLVMESMTLEERRVLEL